ncbi:MAG: hypothetical protein LW699_07870, partial [Pirellula sp.]|nr:hypothetical protein [Pirellula sp.]
MSRNAEPEVPLGPSEQLSTPLKLTETGIRIKPTLAFGHFSLDPMRTGRFARDDTHGTIRTGRYAR